MTSNNTPAVAHTSDSIDDMIQWSRAMAAGDLLPAQYRQKPANLMFAAEYADALGISRIHALTSIAVINGRPSPSADLMAAMVRKAGHRLRVTGDDSHAVAELIRADDPEFVFRAEWDMGKAKQADLLDKPGPWRQYPAAMLKARAISEVVRMGAQEVMAGGIYTPEELGARVDASGNPTSYPVRAEARRADRPATRPLAERLSAPGGEEPAEAVDVDAMAEEAAAADSMEALTAVHDRARTALGAGTLAPDEFEDLRTVLNARAEDLRAASNETTGEEA